MQDLFEKFNSSDFELSQNAADEIARRNTREGNEFLIKQLSSNDNLKRNTSALGMSESRNEFFKEPLLQRILELGTKEDIGTLVYALESFDCSDLLVEIIKLHVNGSDEVKMGTSTILLEQKFKISEQEKNIINQELNKDDWTIDELEINYKIRKDAL